MKIIDHKNVGTNKGGPNLLVYVLAAIVASFIFICWIYLLPHILKKEIGFENQKNNFQKINEEAVGTLDEIKEIIDDVGEKLKEIKFEISPLEQSTSTQAATPSGSGVDVELFKEKILEYKNQEK